VIEREPYSVRLARYIDERTEALQEFQPRFDRADRRREDRWLNKPASPPALQPAQIRFNRAMRRAHLLRQCRSGCLLCSAKLPQWPRMAGWRRLYGKAIVHYAVRQEIRRMVKQGADRQQNAMSSATESAAG